MKKIFLAFTICIFIFLNINFEKKVVPTFNQKDNDYSFYVLEFNDNNVSTNNFTKYFNDIEVIWIEAYINPLYNNIKKRYEFKNIVIFKNNLIEKFIENGYRSEAINLKIAGIIIKKVKVYCSESDIYNLKIKNMSFDIIND